MVTMQYTRIHTDENGESHFEDGYADRTPVEYAPPNPRRPIRPDGSVTGTRPPDGRSFFLSTGKIGGTVSDEEVRRFGQWNIVLPRGHRREVSYHTSDWKPGRPRSVRASLPD